MPFAAIHFDYFIRVSTQITNIMCWRCVLTFELPHFSSVVFVSFHLHVLRSFCYNFELTFPEFRMFAFPGFRPPTTIWLVAIISVQSGRAGAGARESSHSKLLVRLCGICKFLLHTLRGELSRASGYTRARITGRSNNSLPPPFQFRSRSINSPPRCALRTRTSRV